MINFNKLLPLALAFTLINTALAGDKEITVFDHENQVYTQEIIYGGDVLYWFYNSTIGRWISDIATSTTVSNIAGFFQETKSSRKKVKKFVNDFNIKLEEFKPGSLKYSGLENKWKSYNHFNEFFVREFIQGKRNFSKSKTDFPAVAEARYLILENLEDDTTFPVKGRELTAHALLKKEKLAEEFKDSVVVIARLNPTDYHRYHFPDDGRLVESYRINGVLHSVNPIALGLHDEVFSQNERVVSIFDTKNFGKIAYIEVGAMMVGKIEQIFKGTNFKKGKQKGMFKFGGSTVIMLVNKDRVQFNRDIVHRSESQNVETLIKLGTTIGVSSN